MKALNEIGRNAKEASKELAKLGITQRNNALNKVADALVKRADYIKEANEADLSNGRKNGMSTALLDRLLLTDARIEGMADGLRVLAGLDDPIGEIKSMKTRPNGLMIGRKTVPLGVIAIIYESRPNVTADAFGLCFKSANACILRGGSDSLNSNIAIVNVIADVLKKSVREILEDINREDQKVASAVQKAIPQIEHLVNLIVPRMRQGGRIFYMGAGTSGRLGVLDASEVPPTFGMSPNWIIGLIAGGDTALRNPVEGAEDDTNRGWEELTEHHINNKDTVIGIAASGTTPYVIGALHEARKQGILTGCITSNPDSPMAAEADVAIEMIVGPEYVTGSSRMKSGTGQKMILNMISTSVMIQLGRVKGNKMVNMQLSNQKLVERGTRMIMEELGLDHDHAQKLLLLHGSVKKVIDANSQSFHRNTKSN